MERDTFNPYNFESSPEKSEDKKDEKKKKKSATDLAKLLARQEADAEKAKDTESSSEKPITGSSKAEQSAESDQEVPLETLSSSEEMEAAEVYVEERTKELSDEVDNAGQNPELVAETEANQAFVEALQQRLEAGGEGQTIDDAIEAAFTDVRNEFDLEEVDIEMADAASKDLGGPEPLTDEPHDLDPDQAIPLASPSNAGGAGGRPPLPPTPSFGSSASGNPDFFGNRASRAATQETGGLDTADVARYERRAAGRGLLVGGVVGYMIGRRRGRIKTEKRLKVIQEKLEKQVEQVQQKVAQKEAVIRSMAHEKARTHPEKFATAKSSTNPERKPVSAPERRSTRQPEAANAAVDSLSKEELLAFSAQIKVGETSLRRVFEAKMIDEKGLRRLIKEYQAGHDLRRALAREFMVKELRFERDPTLRDLLPPEAQPRHKSETREVDSIDNAGTAMGAASGTAQPVQQTDPSKTPQTGYTQSQNRPVKTRQANVSPFVLIALTVLTISLALYAIWLTLTR